MEQEDITRRLINGTTFLRIPSAGEARISSSSCVGGELLVSAIFDKAAIKEANVAVGDLAFYFNRRSDLTLFEHPNLPRDFEERPMTITGIYSDAGEGFLSVSARPAELGR